VAVGSALVKLWIMETVEMPMTASTSKTAWPSIHCAIYFIAWLLVSLFLPTLQWPWHLLLPLAIYGCLAAFIPILRRTITWPSAGRVDGVGLIPAVSLSVLTAAVLIAFQALVHPDVTGLCAALPVDAFGSVVLAGACFSIGNAIMEELIFRWLLYEAVAAEWGSSLAIVGTAVCFGVGHIHGYPPGPIGVILAGLYGVFLGLLRWRSGGLCLAIGCHATADATIFGILASTGAFVDS
jgi:uncharacterized protein